MNRRDTDDLARGRTDAQPIHVGDTVMISAEVLRSVDGVGALVKLFSKTDELKVWVAEDHLMYALVNDSLPEEPPNGTYLETPPNKDGNCRIFHRDDAEGRNDPDRRHDRHWWSFVDQEWMDWPKAVSLGARPTNRRLIPQEESHE